jgi:hypothetical protein
LLLNFNKIVELKLLILGVQQVHDIFSIAVYLWIMVFFLVAEAVRDGLIRNSGNGSMRHFTRSIALNSLRMAPFSAR